MSGKALTLLGWRVAVNGPYGRVTHEHKQLHLRWHWHCFGNCTAYIRTIGQSPTSAAGRWC